MIKFKSTRSYLLKSIANAERSDIDKEIQNRMQLISTVSKLKPFDELIKKQLTKEEIDEINLDAIKQAAELQNED